MEDWMRECDKLMGEDEDGYPCPLLTEFTEDTSPGSLLSRLDSFLDGAEPSQALIDEVRDHLVSGVLTPTVDRIVSTWSANTVTPEAQRSLHEHVNLMDDKSQFLHRVLSEILQRPSWRHLHQSVYRAVNDILLAVIPVAKQYPHNPDDFVDTVLHFQVRPFLCRFSIAAWSGYGAWSGASKPITKMPTDLIVPTMRRLAMHDVLDDDFMSMGEWNELISSMNKCLDVPVVKDSSDKILQEKTFIWRKSRNSIQCRRMMNSQSVYMRHMPPASQCFEYFSKCSVGGCSNIETPEKPHPHRCTKCYYFHFCSNACNQYAEMFDLHDCDATPREKVEGIKRATEAYLGLNKKRGSPESKHERCNFCKTMRENATKGKLLQCTRCKGVSYCDRDCQQWDWPEHKGVCKKK